MFNKKMKQRIELLADKIEWRSGEIQRLREGYYELDDKINRIMDYYDIKEESQDTVVIIEKESK